MCIHSLNGRRFVISTGLDSIRIHVVEMIVQKHDQMSDESGPSPDRLSVPDQSLSLRGPLTRRVLCSTQYILRTA